MDGTCPFCDDDSQLQTFENLDVVRCAIYGGYLATYQCDAIAGPSGDGYCKSCPRIDFNSGKIGDAFIKDAEDESPFRKVVDGQGFLCENCHHGVNFDTNEVFQELFMKHDEKTCKHCTLHNQRDPTNPVKKPGN